MPESDVTEALKPTMTPYFGRDVTQSRIEIRNVGGGLQEALKFDPVELDPDEERWVAVRVRVDGIRFDHIKDSDCLARVHIFKPVDDQISFLDDDPDLVSRVEKHIAGRTEKIRVAREREAGILTLLDGGGDGDDEDEPFGHEPEREDGWGEPEDEDEE